MKKKSLIVTVAAVAAIAALGVGATLAYFTSQDDATNTFTLGNITATLEEDWDSEDAENIEPTQTITKAPSVLVSTGSNDAYVMIKVEVPRANVQVEGAESAAIIDLFTLNNIDTTNWTLIESDSDDTNLVSTYVYGYNTTVVADEETTALFDSVTFANVVEGAGLEDATFDIEVNGYAVQTTGFASATEAWNATFGN